MPTRTYLEQRARSDLRPAAPPSAGALVSRVERCEPSFWRQLYTEVGGPYHWIDRLVWSDDEIRAYLADPAVSLWVLTLDGTVAGYFELQRHAEPDEPHPDDRHPDDPHPDDRHPDDSVVSGFSRTFSVEIAYFGLMPGFIGKGLGKYLLSEAAARAWDLEPARVWLHTSTFDHPAALPNYLARGFRVFRREEY